MRKNSSSETRFEIRDYRPEDGPAVIEIIKSVAGEYNYTIDFEEFDHDLIDIPKTYQDSGGAFWVVTDGATVVGTVAVIPHYSEACELRRFYVRKSYRGKGLGSRLINTVYGWALSNGYRRIVLWSDVLFEPAHQLYLKHGFTASEKTRSTDPANPTSVERFFVKENL